MRKNGKGVGDPHPQWDSDERFRAKARLLMKDPDAIRSQILSNGLILPLAGEQDFVEIAGQGVMTKFQARVRETPIVNVWASAVLAQASLPGFTPPIIEDWGPKVTQFLENVDGSGTPVKEYFYAAVQKAHQEGLWLTRVSWPSVQGVPYSEIPMPRWVDVSPAEMIWWDVELDAKSGSHSLKEARVRTESEVISSGDDPNSWGVENKKTVHVYRKDEGGRALFRVYTTSKTSYSYEDTTAAYAREHQLSLRSDGWIGIQGFTDKPLAGLGIVPWYGQRVGPYRGVPPFLTEADSQVRLFQMRSLLYSLVRKNARLRISVPGDLTNEKFVAQTDAQSDYLFVEGGDAKVVESGGSILDFSLRLIEQEEEHIRSSVAGSYDNAERAHVTATEVAVRGVETRSRLECVVAMAAGSLRSLLRYTADVLGEKYGTVSVEKVSGQDDEGSSGREAGEEVSSGSEGG